MVFDMQLISFWPWALVGAAVIGLITGLVVRLVNKESAGAVVGGVIESCLYTALGCAGGLAAGLFFSWLLPAEFFALVAFTLGALCIIGTVLGFIHGTAGIGGKILGLFAYLVFAAVMVVAGILIWDAERGDGYVAWFAGFLALTGGTMGLMFALYRSAHWSIGWLLSFLNGSWGALGNLLGLFLHMGSWTFFSATAASPRKVLLDSDRLFFHCWQNGMRILPNYFFSQGPVMTAWTKKGMWHEAVHVMQHYIFGPLMPISYFAWTIVMGFFGAIVGLIKRDGLMHGAFAWGYLNNPWEVWEYQSSWGTSTSTPRRVSSSITPDVNARTAMVFPGGLAWTLTVIYLLAWVSLFVLAIVFSVG
ncbi:MAG: hypothetical protein K0U72_01690 [Gammaproteobacteria bacterium]|nr:hypothetical protein [Gammaproteobacteria bacterium]